MIANIKFLEKYCKDYTKIENYEEALSSPIRYDLHHRLEISEMQSRSDLIFLHLYYNRPPEELIFLSHGEHIRLHKAGKHLSAELRQKMSDAKKGKHRPAFSIEWKQKMSEAMKGKHHSEETKQKISEAMKGKHWQLENGHRVLTD